MRLLLLTPAVLIALLLLPAPHARADDPLVCVDPGATHIGDVITIDPPEVCLL